MNGLQAVLLLHKLMEKQCKKCQNTCCSQEQKGDKISTFRFRGTIGGYYRFENIEPSKKLGLYFPTGDLLTTNCGHFKEKRNA